MRTAACLSVLVVSAMTVLSAPARASLLPQIEAARQLGTQAHLTSLPVTKHYVEVAPGVYVAVKGEKERRQVRFARWVDGLRGDRQAVYETEGFPTHHFYETAAGDRTEQWVYTERGLVFVFRGDVLTDVRGY
jgi:hypothetical protein